MKGSAEHHVGEAASVLCHNPKLRRSVAANTPCATPSRTASSRYFVDFRCEGENGPMEATHAGMTRE